MTLQRVRAFIRSRIRYRITAGGALFSLALVLTATAAFVSGNNLLFLLFSLMLAFILVSGFLSRLGLSGLELELLLPEHVCAKTRTPARIRLRNLKRLTPSLSIDLSGRMRALDQSAPIMTEPLYYPLIAGRNEIESAVYVTFPHRGRHREDLFQIATRFPFGFLRKSTTVELHRETIVYPALLPEPEDEWIADDIAGEIAADARGQGHDFYRIRPYTPSDTARLVDWKATAHSGDLQVREFTREVESRVEIYFDLRAGRAGIDTAWFERMTERCAWLAWTFSERDVPVLFRSQRHRVVMPEEGEVWDVLRDLALAEPLLAGGTVDPPEDASHLQIVISAFPEEFEAAGWTAAACVGSGLKPVPAA